MRAIQSAALDLFEARGYAAVSVEEIAGRADVSPSTVYRYFGTKPGTLLRDEFDASMAEDVAALLANADLSATWDTFAVAYAELLGPGRDATANPDILRRLHWFVTEPDVRRALSEVLDAHARIMGDALAATGRMSALQAHCVARAFEAAVWAAIERWYADGASTPLVGHLREGLALIRLDLGGQASPRSSRPTA